jgi:hypothetical protein
LPRRASLASGRVALRVGESRYFDDAAGGVLLNRPARREPPQTFSGRRPAGAGGARQRGRAHAGIGADRGQQPPLGGLRFGRLDEAPGLARPRPRRERRRRMRSTSGLASSLMRPPYRHLRWPCAQVQAHHGAALIPAQRLGSSTSAIAARASIAIVVAVGAVRRVWVTVGAAAVTR